MDKTTNLALSQWGAGDRVTRADFNGDNQKIDAAVGALRTADATMQGSISALQGSVSSLQTAVAGKCSVIVGTYTGDGAAERTISLGVTPKAVLVFMERGYTYNGAWYFGGLALRDAPARVSADHPVVTVTTGGFVVYSDSSASIASNNPTVHHYIALY